jgi:hypothetical protein
MDGVIQTNFGNKKSDPSLSRFFIKFLILFQVEGNRCFIPI